MMNNLKKPKDMIDGILLLDKPIGLSSNAALQTVKRLLNAKKAGHTGSLDPLASGMLPLCFGEATKFSQYLLDADKTYSVKAKLGVRTTTSDAEGEVVSVRPVPMLEIGDIDQAFAAFRGESLQIPSMFSALKHQGQPLYKLARQGISVDRPARTIHVYALNVLDYQNEIIEFEMRCSKGTYVRTIVDDLGEQLGCGAHVIELRRPSVGSFQIKQMVTLETLESACQENLSEVLSRYLLPIAESVLHLPNLSLTEGMAYYFRRGQSIQVPYAPVEGMVALQLKNGQFVGVGEILDDGKVAPRRLVVPVAA